MTHTVRTTMRPWLEVEVDEPTYLDLKRQGLIHTDREPAAPAVAVKKTTPAPPASGATKEG